MTSLVDMATMDLVAMALLVRVVLVHLVLHAQRMRMMVDRSMTMMRSDYSFQIQLAAPLCFVDLLTTFCGDG